MRLLTRASDYVNISEITNELKTNDRTIQSDIKEISESELNKIFNFENHSGNYKVNLKNNVSVDAFGYYMMGNNNCFQILEYAFFNNDLSAEKIAEIHHFSLPTLYRIIGRINKGIKQSYNLKFETNPCRLVRDEVEVRSFYIQYFTERYPASHWSFPDIDRRKLLDLFKSFTQTLGFKLQYSDLKFLELSIAVSHTRCKQGYYMDSPGPRLSAILSYLNSNPEFFKMFVGIFKSNPNEKVFNDNLIYIIKEHFFFNYEELLKSSETDDYSAKSLNHLNQMIDEISEHYDIPVINRNQLVYNIHNSAELGIRNVNVRPILIDNKYILLSEFKDLFPIFYEDIRTRMIHYLELMDIKHTDALVNHLLHTFITRWEDLYKTLYTSQRKIKIRIVSSHDIYHAKLMLGMIKTELYQQVDASLIDSYDLEHLLENKEDIDILVTNFTLSHKDATIVAVNDIPTNKDFKIINELIKEIRMTDH